MVIILKILLAIILILSGYTSYFIFSEYRKMKKNKELEEGSMFDRFLIFLLAGGGILFLIATGLISALLLFSKITIEMPW